MLVTANIYCQFPTSTDGSVCEIKVCFFSLIKAQKLLQFIGDEVAANENRLPISAL